MRRVAVIVAAFAVAGGGIYAAADYLLHGQYIASTDDAYVEADISTLSARVSGYVSTIDVVENQMVKAGDVLLTIEQRDFAARVAQAQGLVASRQAAVANTEAKLNWEQAMIASADANVTSAKADQRRTQDDLQRYGALRQSKSASAQRYETALAESEKANAAVERANSALEAERAQVRVLETGLAQAKAELAQAEAQLKLAQIDLENTTIRAPVDGVVGNRAAELGQFVRVGAQLMSVVPLPHVYVVANFKETQVAEIRRGQPVEIKADAFPDAHIAGRVESFSPATGSQFALLPQENATGNFTKIVQRVPVRIALKTDDAAISFLRPGMSVVVDIDTREEGEGPDAVLAAHPRPEKTAQEAEAAKDVAVDHTN